MSQVTATTSTPPINVCSGASPITMNVTWFLLMWTSQHWVSMDLAAFSQHDVLLLPPLTLRDTMKGYVGLTTMPQQQQPQSHMPSQTYENYAIGPSQVHFSFRVWSPPTSLCWCLLWCLLLFLGLHVAAMFTNEGSAIGVCIVATYGVHLWQAYVSPCDGT